MASISQRSARPTEVSKLFLDSGEAIGGYVMADGTVRLAVYDEFAAEAADAQIVLLAEQNELLVIIADRLQTLIDQSR